MVFDSGLQTIDVAELSLHKISETWSKAGKDLQKACRSWSVLFSVVERAAKPLSCRNSTKSTVSEGIQEISSFIQPLTISSRGDWLFHKSGVSCCDFAPSHVVILRQ